MLLLLILVNILVVIDVKEWKKHLNDFYCNKWSPLDEAYVSNTDPPVAITHIFCGQITIHRGRDGYEPKAEGFHARPGNRNPNSATIDTKSRKPVALGNPTQICPYRVRAMDVKVLDAKLNTYIPRTTDPDRTFIFFPPAWGKHDIVQNITRVFQTCTANGQQNPNCVKDTDQNNRLTGICMRNYIYNITGASCSIENLAFKIFLRWQGRDRNNKDKYRVVTAFPDEGCSCRA